MFIGHITRTGFRAASPEAGLQLRDALRESPAVVLERLIESSLLEEWVRAAESAEFKLRVHKNAAAWGGRPPSDYKAVDPLLAGRFMFSFNDAALLNLIETAVGTGPVQSFLGTVMRTTASPDVHDQWHDDMNGVNVIALSLNLSPEPYDGGRLRLRDLDSEAILFEAAHGDCGNAILFRIADDLQHIVTPIEPGPARTVFVGWFQNTPPFGWKQP